MGVLVRRDTFLDHLNLEPLQKTKLIWFMTVCFCNKYRNFSNCFRGESAQCKLLHTERYSKEISFCFCLICLYVLVPKSSSLSGLYIYSYPEIMVMA